MGFLGPQKLPERLTNLKLSPRRSLPGLQICPRYFERNVGGLNGLTSEMLGESNLKF